MLTIEEIKSAVTKVCKQNNIRTAYLFGSYAKGVADEMSDVDLFVDSGLKGMKYAGFVEKIRNALGDRDVDVIDKTHVDERSDFSNEIMNTGILLYER